MAGNMAGKWKNKKRLGLIVAGIVLLAAIVMILIAVVFGNGAWTEGGTNTKGAFRYRSRFDGSLEVRVSTVALPEGSLTLKTDDTTQLKTSDGEQKGDELVYYITGDEVSYENWMLVLYESPEAGKDPAERYALSLDICQDADGKLEVVAANVYDIAPVQSVQIKDYNFESQIQEQGELTVSIYMPMQIRWYAQCDDSLLYVDNFFYDQEYATTSVFCTTDQEFETDVCFYTLKDTTTDQEIRLDEIHLNVKGKDGRITEVTYE